MRLSCTLAAFFAVAEGLSSRMFLSCTHEGCSHNPGVLGLGTFHTD